MTRHGLRTRLIGAALAALVAVVGVGAAGAQLMATPAASTAGATGPSVVASGWGTATAPADGAIVQFVVRLLGVADDLGSGGDGAAEPSNVSAPTSPPTKDQVNRLVTVLVDAGVAKDRTISAIVPAGPYYGTFGPGTAVVAFELGHDQLGKTGKIVNAALKQATEIGLSFDSINLVYTVADCQSVADQALAAAIEDAKTQETSMATALGLGLGGLIQAVSQTSYGKYYGGGQGGNYCSQPATLESARTSYFTAYDPTAKAEVSITSSVTLTYVLS